MNRSYVNVSVGHKQAILKIKLKQCSNKISLGGSAEGWGGTAFLYGSIYLHILNDFPELFKVGMCAREVKIINLQEKQNIGFGIEQIFGLFATMHKGSTANPSSYCSPS